MQYFLDQFFLYNKSILIDIPLSLFKQYELPLISNEKPCNILEL